MILLDTPEKLSNLMRNKFEARTIAIVGSSPKLLGTSYGKKIDAHDHVIRFNDADCRGHEEDVGKRTSVRVVGFNINEKNKPFFDRLQENALLITKKVNVSKLNLREDDVVLGFSIHANCFPVIDRLFQTNFSSRSSMPPRTGLSFLAALLGSGASVSVFGMETISRSQGALHYYSEGNELVSAMQRWETYHCPLEVEMEALGIVLEKGVEIHHYYA